MRKFSIKNKIAFAVFGVLILACVGGLSFLVLKTIEKKPAQIDTSAGSVIYSTDDEIVVVDTDSQIFKKRERQHRYMSHINGHPP